MTCCTRLSLGRVTHHDMLYKAVIREGDTNPYCSVNAFFLVCRIHPVRSFASLS